MMQRRTLILKSVFSCKPELGAALQTAARRMLFRVLVNINGNRCGKGLCLPPACLMAVHTPSWRDLFVFTSENDGKVNVTVA